jgi:hypothetical protein
MNTTPPDFTEKLRQLRVKHGFFQQGYGQDYAKKIEFFSEALELLREYKVSLQTELMRDQFIMRLPGGYYHHMRRRIERQRMGETVDPIVIDINRLHELMKGYEVTDADIMDVYGISSLEMHNIRFPSTLEVVHRKQA